MRNRWYIGLLLLAGCVPTQMLPEEPSTLQVASTPFAEPKKPLPTRVNYAPASQQTAYRVELIRSKLVGENPQAGLRPFVTAVETVPKSM